MTTCSSILAWKILCTEEPGGLQSMGLQRVRHDWATDTHTHTHTHTHTQRVLAVVLSLSHVQLFVTLCIAACQASLSFTISCSLLKLMSIESMMPSNHLIFCHPLLLLSSISPSIRVFSNESTFPKYGSFSLSISPSNKQSELISFRIDWFDLLAIQGTLKSLLQGSC